MKRSELEKTLRQVQTDVRSKIEAQPIPAVVIALVVGAAVAMFSKLLIPLLIIAALAVCVLWVLSDRDDIETELGADSGQSQAGKGQFNDQTDNNDNASDNRLSSLYHGDDSTDSS